MDVVRICCILLYAFLFAKAQNFEAPDSIQEVQKQKGKEKLEEIKNIAQYSVCWKNALDNLHSSCRTISDNEQRRLALAFANCHFESSNRKTYPCPIESDISECTGPNKMDSGAFDVYTQFFTHSSNMCFFLQSVLWQEMTEKTVNKLSDTSEAAVEKLEASLEHQKELERKQNIAIHNQDTMLDQNSQLAESLQTTKANMDQAFQEMYAKAENQKVILDDVLGTLRSGFGNIQWIMSSILGEIITIETAGFFIVSLLLITLLPQFGTSRLWMYVTLIVYGLYEGVSRKIFFVFIDPSKPDVMSSLHSYLWYSRWGAFILLVLVFSWRYWRFTGRERKQESLLNDMNRQLHYIKQSLHIDRVGGATVQSDNYENSFVAEDSRSDGYLSSPGIGSDHTDSGPTSSTIPVGQFYQDQNKGGRIVSGTQLVDFLSGIYIRDNAHSLPNDDIYTTSQTDDTYRPRSSAISTVTDSGSLEDTEENDNCSEFDTASLTRSPLLGRPGSNQQSLFSQQNVHSQEFPHASLNDSFVSTQSSPCISLTLERCAVPSKRRKTARVSSTGPTTPVNTTTVETIIKESTPIGHQKRKKRKIVPNYRTEDEDSGFGTDSSGRFRGTRYNLRSRQQTPSVLD